MHTLKHATRRDGSRIGEVISLTQICLPTHIIPCFGKAANPHLHSHNSYELLTDFWLNKYWNKQFFYSLLPT
ncbi:hypothetical protein JVT61DRAFT_44 [Boletus reticuloceps]|uniref:Uncharacterized protein n=1 Tax=Boletus reticuloceps TaxID=495285 RepID=A0A8I3AGE3_9AGAM|nr:hypothetical protein JVT61DRAFT_44 [Boletus reticuloceps]